MIDDANPVKLVQMLSAGELRKRLDQLEGERAALLVLLRAARARERKGHKHEAVQRKSSR